MNRGKGAIFTFVYRLLSVGVFSSAIMLYVSAFYGATWKHFAILVLTEALFFGARELPKRQRIYVVLIAVPFLALAFGIMGKEKLGMWILSESSYLWTLVLAVSACVLQLLSEKYVSVKVSFSVILCGMLFYSLFAKRYVPKIGVLFLLLYVVMTMTESVWRRSQRKEKGNCHAYIVWLAPFFTLYFGILVLMPAPQTPYSWQWLKDIYLRVEEKITIYAENLVNRNDEDLDGAISGFSESATLFSNIAADDKNIMVIETASGKKQPLYLAGKIYDVFDGRNWSSTKEADARERLFDTMETVSALEAYVKEDADHLIYDNGIRAKAGYRHFHTDYLLAPSKTWKIEGRSSYRQSGADLVFDKKAGYGTEYTFQYCRMNMGRETTRDFLQSDGTGQADLWESTVKAYAEDEITYVQLLSYRETMWERYLPETTLDPETEEWLAAVTKDAEDEIDGLFCIEEALAGMEYNVNPGGLPKEVKDAQRFLHYFLLEKQEGFCTYYATAFVLLARAEGFPARYVQGFSVPLRNEKETEVYSGMAHAWPEVYFEGKGWIPFEPTPGYSVRRYPAEPEKKEKKESGAQAKEFAEREYSFGNSETPNDEEEEEQRKREEQRRELRKAAVFAATCLLLIFAVGALLFITDRLSEKYREKRRSIGDRYRLAVLRNLRILSVLGYEREGFETYHELAERIKRDEEETEIETGFIETYESSLYGTLAAGERELEECFRQRERLLQTLHQRKGKKYVFYWLKFSVM